MLSPKITALDKVITLACRENKRCSDGNKVFTWLETEYFHIHHKDCSKVHLWSNTSCVEGKSSAWFVTRNIQSQTNQNPQKCKPKIMTVYGTGEKTTVSSRKAVSFSFTSSPGVCPGSPQHDFTRAVPHEQGDRSKHPVTGNNTHVLPMNGDSDLTDRTLGNNIKLQGNVSAYGQEVKICNIEKS